MTYTFVKIKSKMDGKAHWYFRPKDELQVIEHWYKYPAAIIKEGTHIMVRKVLKTVNGHFRNNFEIAVEAYMSATGQDLRTALISVENKAFSSRLKDFGKREIFLNQDMQVLLLDERIAEIVETVEKDALTFPDEEKPEMKDVRLLVWPGGSHYYAKIGNLDVTDEQGNQKWNTKEEAMKAAEYYINKNWKGGDNV